MEGWPRETYSLAPLRAALVAEEAGRLREFSLAVFRTFFVDGRPLGEPEALGDAAENAGLDPAAVLEGAERDEVKSRLQHVTEQAIELGVPGVPTVAVGDELFWGDDRLEDAAAARK